MDITSPLFIVFILLTSSVYYLLPHKFRSVLLIIASVLFLICFDLRLIIILLPYITFNYLFVKLLQNNYQTQVKKVLLSIPIIFDVLLLGIYKYLFFIVDNLKILFPNVIIDSGFDFKDIIVPIGISFFTFKMISLLVDSYRGKIKYLSYLNTFLYIIFFPEFLSGPISRFAWFSRQVTKERDFEINNIFVGISRIILGLFKKLVISNSISILINPVYANYPNYTSLDLFIASLLFSIQIFTDFSGYIDIMLGTGKLLGLDLPENFNQPYLATSIKDFWHKWHITLSSWFKDYIYIPLGGSRHGEVRQYFNIMVVFFITGIWHGSNWNYIVWGALHGTYQVITALINKYSNSLHINTKIQKIIGITTTFTFVNFTWIYFRGASLEQANGIISKIFSFQPTLSINLDSLIVPIFLSTIICLVNIAKFSHPALVKVRTIVSLAILLFGVSFFASTQAQDFLYFKF